MPARGTAVKERPILFSAPMVRAILAGAKTQTRRIANKPVRHPDLGNLYAPGALVLEREPQHVIARSCPYGQPSDRLWVKETWRTADALDALSPSAIADKCLGAGYSKPWAPLQWEADGQRNGAWSGFGPGNGVVVGPGKTRVSIHMPRWASRITPEITGVRVERLQDISEADALAEGIVFQPGGGYGLADTTHYHATDPRQSYFSLWEAINGDGSVAANPWVWAVEFRRLP